MWHYRDQVDRDLAEKSERLLAIYRAGLPFTETVEAVLVALAEGEGWAAAALWAPDAYERAMIGVAVWISDPKFEPFAEASRGMALPIETTTIGRCWRSGKPIWVEDVATAEGFLRKDLLLDCGLSSASFVPIAHKDQVLGVIEFVASRSTGEEVRQADVTRDVLDGLGGLLHTHIEGERTRRQQVRLELALEAGRMGTWEWDRRTGHVVWSTSLEEIYGFAPGEFPGTYDAYQERIHPDDREALAQRLAETVDQPRIHHVVHRIIRPDGEVRWIEGHGRPMVEANGDLIGLIGVSSDVTEREQLLIDLAAQMELTRSALADRSLVADTLQRSLRPDQLPSIPGVDMAAGFRPGTGMVGGDFYDAFEHEGAWYLYLGDVCGQGPEAAAQTGVARHAIKGLVTAGVVDPSRILEALNGILLAGTSERRFVTLVLARVVPGSPAQIEVCRAGHPPPVVRPASGAAHLLELVPGTLLGALDDVQLRTEPLRLWSGDALVFYTDGATETRQGGEMFGEARFVAAVDEAPRDPDGLVAHLLGQIERFDEGGSPDDVALVVVRAAG